MSGTETVGIVGVGLIGASIGLRARQCGRRVIAFDCSNDNLLAARRLGAIDEAQSSLRAVAASCETLVLAMPIEATIASIEELSRLAGGPSLVIDVASVKGRVVAAAEQLGSFVGTHPIAGSERSGPAAARADLFAGRIWAYVPRDAVLDARAIAFIEMTGALSLGIGAAEHDRVIAATSHLPQVLSVALGAELAPRLADDVTLALCGTGIRSMTRLGASSWTMWRGILESNAPNIAQEVRALAAILGSVADEIANGELDALGARFFDAAATDARLHENDSDSFRVS
ncbi:MAG TPA: prephenate dehydrogenase/arogenate dehydrogenase family protein [Candidatus Baltobacteraceae bacterium]